MNDFIDDATKVMHVLLYYMQKNDLFLLVRFVEFSFIVADTFVVCLVEFSCATVTKFLKEVIADPA